MRGCKWTGRDLANYATRGLLVIVAMGCAVGADIPHGVDHADPHANHQTSAPPASTDGVISTAENLLENAIDRFRMIGGRLAAWYLRTPPADRVTWGAMTACAGLGLGVLLERLVRLRGSKIVPPDFTARFLDRLHEGKLDCGKALDHCELNPSPAARVALAAVRRWERPAADQERAVALAHRVESEQLRRNVGTLRRIAVMAPLLGLLGTLFAVGRALEAVPTERAIAWGPLVAAALAPLTAGIIVATLALVAYDGLLTRIEKLAGALDRLGAETIDAIALTVPVSSPSITLAPVPVLARTPHQSSLRTGYDADSSVRSGEQETGF
jgi:biopolymer transport protein ExbB